MSGRLRIVGLTSERSEDSGFRLSRGCFLHLEQVIESALLDGLKEGGCDVHMRVEGVLSCGKFW